MGRHSEPPAPPERRGPFHPRDGTGARYLGALSTLGSDPVSLRPIRRIAGEPGALFAMDAKKRRDASGRALRISAFDPRSRGKYPARTLLTVGLRTDGAGTPGRRDA